MLTLTANRLLPNWFYIMQDGRKIGSTYAQWYPNRSRNEWVIVLDNKRIVPNCLTLDSVIPSLTNN